MYRCWFALMNKNAKKNYQGQGVMWLPAGTQSLNTADNKLRYMYLLKLTNQMVPLIYAIEGLCCWAVIWITLQSACSTFFIPWRHRQKATSKYHVIPRNYRTYSTVTILNTSNMNTQILLRRFTCFCFYAALACGRADYHSIPSRLNFK